jgi:hypothetical protein
VNAYSLPDPDQNFDSEFAEAFDQAEAAADRLPLPRGRYACRIARIERFQSRSGTPGIKLEFRVAKGEHEGRRLWLDCWATTNALPRTKRELAKLGIATSAQLAAPDWPRLGRLRLFVVATVRTGDDGRQWNDVAGFEVQGIDDEPAPHPFDVPLNQTRREG